MKFLIALAALLAIAACGPVDPHFVAVTEDTLGNYRFRFDAGDHSKKEERTQDGFTKGHFFFVDPEGASHRLDYTGGADQGFIASGSDLPSAPLPVPETPEVIKAREEHLAAWNAAAEANGIFEEGSVLETRRIPAVSPARKTIKVLVPVVQYVRV